MKDPKTMSTAELQLAFDSLDNECVSESFATFVAYNFRDVDGLLQLDEKFKFIALANQMAHENTVGFDAVLGTVAYVETGITLHAHNVLNRIVNDKKISVNEKVEGAIVLTPTPGMYNWIGSVDINSLYPNIIRSLNISPEMIIGQFTASEAAWAAINGEGDPTQVLCLELESGEQITASPAQWASILTEQKWAISAYGTVFDQSSALGVIPDILKFWYTERKRLQAEKKKWGKEVKRLKDALGINIPEGLCISATTKIITQDTSVNDQSEYRDRAPNV